MLSCHGWTTWCICVDVPSEFDLKMCDWFLLRFFHSKKKERNFYVDVTQVDISVSIARECIVLNIEMKGLRNASKLEVHWMCILLTVCPILQRNPSLERSFLKVDVVNCKIIRWVLDWSIYDRDRSIQIEFRWKSHFPFMQIVIFTLVQASRVD